MTERKPRALPPDFGAPRKRILGGYDEPRSPAARALMEMMQVDKAREELKAHPIPYQRGPSPPGEVSYGAHTGQRAILERKQHYEQHMTDAGFPGRMRYVESQKGYQVQSPDLTIDREYPSIGDRELEQGPTPETPVFHDPGWFAHDSLRVRAPRGPHAQNIKATERKSRALPPFADYSAMYTLPPEAMGTQSRGDELDELLGPAPGGIQALGQNYAMPKDIGRLDESTQKSGAPFNPHTDNLEIKPPATDRGRNIYRGSDIFIIHTRAHVI